MTMSLKLKFGVMRGATVGVVSAVGCHDIAVTLSVDLKRLISNLQI